MNDGAFGAALLQELELETHVGRQCALATTDDERPNEEVALVDQACSDRLAGKLAPPTVMSDLEVSFMRCSSLSSDSET